MILSVIPDCSCAFSFLLQLGPLRVVHCILWQGFDASMGVCQKKFSFFFFFRFSCLMLLLKSCFDESIVWWNWWISLFWGTLKPSNIDQYPIAVDRLWQSAIGVLDWRVKFKISFSIWWISPLFWVVNIQGFSMDPFVELFYSSIQFANQRVHEICTWERTIRLV